jgi:hypothetical protein
MVQIGDGGNGSQNVFAALTIMGEKINTYGLQVQNFQKAY